ncbi:MAG: glycosyltransferase [Bacteroides thetaiotaomicron]|nr:glycosyltransferase [Bacteroides thetaiotaomicron]
MINKFLYPNGGSETYIFKLGDALKAHRHEVQYFGMEHEGRCVGNAVGAYTSDMDFHGGSKLSKLTYPIKTIYSSEARKKIRLVLDDFKPDVCHLNNFNYQLTPSIILEIRKWEKESGHKVKIVFTAHDYQLVCPNHMMNNPATHENCEKCLEGHFLNCTKGKCIHGSTAKSVIGTMEATFWKMNGIYKQIDTIICCSNFMKKKMDTNPIFAEKTIVMHNFTDFVSDSVSTKEDYVLYYGRFSEEKGIKTLLNVCKALPEIKFVFAGTGPLESEIGSLSNVENVGFQTGDKLKDYIKKARMSICPSEWYEPFGLTVIESLKLGTPVIGSDAGGIPESIAKGENGDLFKSGNETELKSLIQFYWNNPDALDSLTNGCLKFECDGSEKYTEKLLSIYRGGGYSVNAYYPALYALHFGRFSEEKGIRTLISVCRELPDVQFIFAGTGPLEDEIQGVNNIKNVGFQTGEALETLIREARFSIYPSEWYENCPFSVMESQMYGTPVLGADIGGIPELITVGKTGELFKSGDKVELKKQIQKLWESKDLTDAYSQNCRCISFDTVEQYYQKIMRIYGS